MNVDSVALLCSQMGACPFFSLSQWRQWRINTERRSQCAVPIFVMLLGLTFIVTLLSSCEKKSEVNMYPTFLYSEYDRYMVSTNDYLRVYSNTDFTSTVLGILRYGEMVEVSAFGRAENEELQWIQITKIIANESLRGWVLPRDPKLYYDKALAQQYSKKLVSALQELKQ